MRSITRGCLVMLRRTDSPDDAADVLAETFLVAWRRLDDMPSGEVSHLWLYGVARRILADHHRGEQRRTKLADRVRDELAARLPLPAPSGEGTPFAAAFRSLSNDDREAEPDQHFCLSERLGCVKFSDQVGGFGLLRGRPGLSGSAIAGQGGR